MMEVVVEDGKFQQSAMSPDKRSKLARELSDSPRTLKRGAMSASFHRLVTKASKAPASRHPTHRRLPAFVQNAQENLDNFEYIGHRYPLILLRSMLAAPSRQQLHALSQRTKRKIQGMFVYLIFVALFTFTILYIRNNQQVFFFSEQVRLHLVEQEFLFADSQVPKTFRDITSVEEVYQYLHGPFFQHIWGGASFDGEVANNQTIPKGSKSFRNPPGWFSGTSRFIGGIRIGTIRSASYDCMLPPAFTAHASEFACFQDYSEADPDTAPFGYPDLLDLKFGSGDEPTYRSPISSDAFGSPSAYLVLPNMDGPKDADGQTPILRKLNALQHNHFIDAKTRVVSVDLTVYNPSLDFTVLVHLSIELNPGGSVVPTYHLQTLRLYSTYDPADMFRTAVEILVLLMVLGYIIKEIVNLCRYGPLKYWFEYASAVHVANLLLFIVAAGYRIRGLMLLPDTVDPTTADYVNFLNAADALDYATNINAFNAFLTWAKTLMYLDFIPRFQVLLGTLRAGVGNIGGFVFICAFILFGSSQAFSLAFGARLFQYRNLTQSFYTLMRALLGDFDFEQLRVVNPLMGPVIFFAFLFLASFVLLNVFIAIIGDAYAASKALSDAPNLLQCAREDAVMWGFAETLCLRAQYERWLQHVTDTVHNGIPEFKGGIGLLKLFGFQELSQSSVVEADRIREMFTTHLDLRVSPQEVIDSLTPMLGSEVTQSLLTDMGFSTKSWVQRIGDIERGLLLMNAAPVIVNRIVPAKSKAEPTSASVPQLINELVIMCLANRIANADFGAALAQFERRFDPRARVGDVLHVLDTVQDELSALRSLWSSNHLGSSGQL